MQFSNGPRKTNKFRTGNYLRPDTPETNLATIEEVGQAAKAYPQHFRGGFGSYQAGFEFPRLNFP